MTLDFAMRLTEILLGLAFLQQSFEHVYASNSERMLFLPRIIFSLLLIMNFHTPWVCLALVILGLFILRRFQGPYNGGSDRMGLLILCCLYLLSFATSLRWREYAFGYLALQTMLSYFMAGWVKIANPEWRQGRALQDVFRFSAYPVSDAICQLAERPRLLWMASWAVMLFELCFPLTLFTQTTLIIGLVLAAIFHLANVWLFGLNRFFWVWLASYPSILWLQARII